MKDLRVLLLSAAMLAPTAAFCGEPPAAACQALLQEGDIVFIQSGTPQAPAIEEVMGSSWTHVGVALKRDSAWLVAETAGTVSLTPLAEFLGHSRDGKVLVKRFKGWGGRPRKKDLAELKKALLAGLGKKYDIYFEWSDTALYCSEYVWKAYHSALPGHPALSKPQKFSDLKLGGPLAKQLIDKRYKSIGKQLRMDETVVTPAALLNSDLLETVTR